MLLAGDRMDLKIYLCLHKMSVTEFAKKMGYSRTHMNSIVTGRLKPALHLAKAIENFTDGEVKVSDLIVDKKEDK